MLAQFDSFGNFEIPQITLCNPDGRALGILSNLSDRQMNIRFNDISDLSFTIQRGAKMCIRDSISTLHLPPIAAVVALKGLARVAVRLAEVAEHGDHADTA